jgi:hypothetical protein
VEKLSAVLEWALRVRLADGLPFLPSTSPHVRDMLMRNVKYMLRVVKLNRQLERWSSRAKEGLLNRPCLPTHPVQLLRPHLRSGGGVLKNSARWRTTISSGTC